MRIEWNYKSVLKSSATPMTPLYTGSWNPKFLTKWLGVAAELSYNPYLRNGWVVVDTGVKGSVGSPLIEFSTWEAEDSDYNITIPNSFSYRFFFKGDRCVAKFLTRSSVEAQEWWFGVSGVSTVLNLWGRAGRTRSSAALRSRVYLTSVKYLNYRFANVTGLPELSLRGFAPLVLNCVNGADGLDFKLRDLSISFLYLNKLVRHRLARVQFYLHEKTVAGCVDPVSNKNLRKFFSEQVFFSAVLSGLSASANHSDWESEDSVFFRPEALRFLSFEGLVGELSITLFLFLEFKAYPVFFKFFSVILKKIVEKLIFTFGVDALTLAGNGDKLRVLASFVVRRLFKFILTAKLSAYSLMWLLIHSVREFARQALFSPAQLGLSADLSALLSLYSYKLKQLMPVLPLGLNAQGGVNEIFWKNTVSVEDLLTSYAKHRGRGLRASRRARPFLSKKRRFNFIGRRPKNYFFKKKSDELATDTAGDFTFSRRLHCLRRALKFSSTSGQFTFLFFWSFQFFNFSQLNLKKRKFFFLTMRVAYFFKSFLRFFKFYAFYFRLLRNLELPSMEVYSGLGNFILNLKAYCMLIFTKFARLLINFRLFCAKIFLLKWKRLCSITLNEMCRLRRSSARSLRASLTNRVDFFIRPVSFTAAHVRSKFLVLSYSSFTNLTKHLSANDSVAKTRHYLRYLLKLRANYLQLYKSQFYAKWVSISSNSVANNSSIFLGRAVVRRVASALAALPRGGDFKELRSRFILAVMGAFASSRSEFLIDRRALYARGLSGVLNKLSLSGLRDLIAKCIARRKFVKHYTGRAVTGKLFVNFKTRFTNNLRFTQFLLFMSNIRRGSAGRPGFALLLKFIWSGLRTVAPVKPGFAALLVVKRYLLTWKALLRQRASKAEMWSRSFLDARVVANSFSFLFFRKMTYLEVAHLLAAGSLFNNKSPAVFNLFRIKEPIRDSIEVAAVNYSAWLPVFAGEVVSFQLNSVLKVLYYLGGFGTLRTFPLYFNINSAGSLFFRRRSQAVSALQFSNPLPLSRNCAAFLRGFGAKGAGLLPEFKSLDFFSIIWGSYLSLNTWPNGTLPLFSQFSLLWTLNHKSFEAFELLADYFDAGLHPLVKLIGVSDYLTKKFLALNSFLTLRGGVLRSALFTSSLNLYLKLFLLGNFFLQSYSVNPVLGAFKSVTQLKNAQYSTNFFSVLTGHKFNLFVTQTLISRSARLVSRALTSTSIFQVPACATVCPLVFTSYTGSLYAKPSKVFFKKNFVRAKRLVCGRFSVPRYSRYLIDRASLSRRSAALRKARRVNSADQYNRLSQLVLKAVPLSKLYIVFYLKNMLRVLQRFTAPSKFSRAGVFSANFYFLRVGKFFNVIRGIPPLKVLTYAKKIGIWPKNLRLFPKKIKPKMVMEINVAKNKQSLVPDKNFKMPPSIFSRENYESMNLIWDFPHDDYKFARVNMYRWVRAWRVTRKHLLKRLLVKIRRQLRTRYFRRTFRYRRFLRKRWFRKRLKKVVIRSLLRVTSKLNAISSLRSVYKGGFCLRRFSTIKLYYSSALTYSLVINKFLSDVYSRFLRLKIDVQHNFMRTLKLQFLFVLIKGFFSKTLTFFASFSWTYRLTFSNDLAVSFFFNKLSTMLLAAPRMYSLGASYYWDEPLSIFNVKLMGNYIAEDFFKVRALPDYLVIRTIGPDYYPYDNLIATLPWRTGNVALFEEYPNFLLSNVFSSAIFQTVAVAKELRSSLENLNVFGEFAKELFTNCGFRIWLPFRRIGSKAAHATPISPYVKPGRRAQVIRLLQKLSILRPLKLFKKFQLHSVRRSRSRLTSIDYICAPYNVFQQLRLRPLYITLFKWKLRRKNYRTLCRAVKIIADAQRQNWRSRVKVLAQNDRFTFSSKTTQTRSRVVVSRRGKIHWRFRKPLSTRYLRLRGLPHFQPQNRSTIFYKRQSKWKRPPLFTVVRPTRRVVGLVNKLDTRGGLVWRRLPARIRRPRRWWAASNFASRKKRAVRAPRPSRASTVKR